MALTSICQRALLASSLACALTSRVASQAPPPDTVVVQSGALSLRGLLWRPQGSGPFPAVLFNHGSGNTLDRELAQAATIGPVFARHGYILLWLFRRGSGLSADQGTSAATMLSQELAAHGQEGRNRLQLQLLERDHLGDALAGLAFLRRLPEVDTRRIAQAGHSFGASLSLVLAERDTGIRATVLFSGSAGSWDHSPELRTRLLGAADASTAPVLFLQAANDYSLAPSEALSEELHRLGKPAGRRIYPPVGTTADDGHGFLFLDVGLWEPDVFDFLDRSLGR